MALILDLIDKDKNYPTGSAEAMWVDAERDGWSLKCRDVITRHLDRYKQEDLAFVEHDLKAECGEEGLAFARWIQGYIGFDGRLPKIDPEMWTKKRDEAGRWVTTPGGTSSTATMKSPTTGIRPTPKSSSPSSISYKSTSTSSTSSSVTWSPLNLSSSGVEALEKWEKELMRGLDKS